MQRNGEQYNNSSSRTYNDSLSVNRRSYLKLAGVAVGSASLLSGPASAAFTRHGIEFERTVNMVTEAGCDPTGNEPCDEKITDAAEDYTLLKFPAGEYKLTDRAVILGATNLGLVGEGEVRFTVPERYNEKAILIDDGTGLLFENIDFDLTAYGATLGLHLGADDDLEVHDVEFIGQGIHPDSDPRGEGGGAPSVTNAFTPIVRSPDGVGNATNVTAENAGLMGAYNNGDGRVGVWIGISHQGTIRLTDCRFEGFPNNGMYCSRTGGAVQVEGGVFRNNDISQVRLSSHDSYVENTIIQADFNDSASPNPADTLNSRGVRFEAGRFGFGGAVARDCNITLRSTPFSDGGVVVGSDGADHAVYDTRIGVEEDGLRGVYAKPPTGIGSRPPPPKPHTFILENVSVTGAAANEQAIRIDQRPDSAVKNCCIEQSGASRNGALFIDANSYAVRDSTIDVTGQQVVEENCEVATSNIADSGSCPVPGTGSGLGRTLSIDSTGGRYSYEFTVSGDLEKRETADPNDTVSGNTASGQGGGNGRDSFGFSGDILAFEVDGDATVYLDGEAVDLARLPDNTVTIDSTGGRYSYEFTVSGDLEKRETADPNDTVSGNTASGQGGGGGRDRYSFSGEITAFDLDGDAVVTLNGERIDVSQYAGNTLTIESSGGRYSYEFTVGGDLEKRDKADPNDTVSGNTAIGQGGDGGIDRFGFSGNIVTFELNGDATAYLDGRQIDPDRYPDHILTIEGSGPRATYQAITTGAIEKSTANGASINANDTVRRTTARGSVLGGTDSYTFSGEIAALRANNSVTITLDGRVIHDTDYPNHVLTVEGTGSRTDYVLTATKVIEKTTVGSASINSNDEISGRTARGFVVGGADSYAFSWQISQLSVEGNARVYLDGRQIDPDRYPN
jgi:hypothetical protein